MFVGFLSSLASKLVQWGISKLWPIISGMYKRMVRNSEIDKTVNEELKAVLKVKHDAEKILKEVEVKEGRQTKLSKSEERRLKDALRTLASFTD
jgi:hypothetical protein